MKDLIVECPELDLLLEDAAETAALLWDKGWAERNAGNLSVDVTEQVKGVGEPPKPIFTHKLEDTYPTLARRFFLVSGSGHRFRDMAMDPTDNACILRMWNDGAGYDVMWGGDLNPDMRPTSEFPSHLRVHEYLLESESGKTVVLHTHPTELISMSHLPDYQTEEALSQALLCVHPEVKVFLPDGVGLAPYTLPGTERLAKATVKGFREGKPLVIWQWHGAVAIGDSVPVAFDLIDTANKAAQILLTCLGAGHKPIGLCDADLEEIHKAWGGKF